MSEDRLTEAEAVRNLGELRGPIPDIHTKAKRLEQANEVLLDHLGSAPVREAYRQALDPEGK